MMISVIMSCHNSNQQYLKESIESILGQTYGDFELLVADNGVEFNLQEFINGFKDTRITYIDNGGNIGPQASYDKLASLAQGEYVAIQDHDDVSRPDRLMVEKIALDNHPEIMSVSGLIHIFGKYDKDDGEPMETERVKQELIFYQPIKQPTFMKRKEFCNKYRYGDRFELYDYEFWSRTREIPHLILGNIVLNYRKSYLNSSKSRKDMIRREHAMIVGRNLYVIGINASVELCRALDPFNHKKHPESVLKEYEGHREKLLEHISNELYERKHKEILGKVQ